MSADGFISMLSLADLYFVTETENGCSYRFQWSTQAVEAAVNGAFNPDIKDYVDDEWETPDEDYYQAKAFYDYVSANKNDGTDQADSFIFRIYDKETGTLVKEISTGEKSVDITGLDGEYLWEVTALKNGQVIKTSDQAYFNTDHAPCFQPERDDDAFRNRDYDDLYSASSENHAIGQMSFSGSSYGNKQAIIISNGNIYSNFFTCGEWDDLYHDSSTDMAMYNKAIEEGYLFSISNLTDRVKYFFPLTENCMYGICGLYVYNDGKWDYIAYSARVNVAYHTSQSDLFYFNNDMLSEKSLKTIYRYNIQTQKIETVAVSNTLLRSISPDGTHYISEDGIYRIKDNKKIISLARTEVPEYFIFDNFAVHLYCETSNGQISEELDEDEKGKVKVTYYHFNDDKAGTSQTLTIYEKDIGIFIDDVDGELFSIQIGNYICYKIDQYQNTEDGYKTTVTSIIHKVENSTVTEVSRETYDAYSISHHYVNEYGDIVVAVANYDECQYITLIENAVDVVPPDTMSGNKNGLSWKESDLNGEEQIVSLITSRGTLALQIEADATELDFYGLPGGSYRCTRQGAGQETKNTVSFSVSSSSGASKLLSDNDGATDLFFNNSRGKWTFGYAAQHAGILNSWSGTNEQVTLAGKNKLADIFEGSTDANILLMTDDANGDALFVDDIYTALPGTVAEQQARIAQIDEIRAGAGDDIVDMTSQRFEYVGDGVKIYGGLGNDTIWANNGSNTLFGDAGNDRIVGGAANDVIVGGIGNDSMHGGGGEDIFCFGENWGVDTVEQLSDGEITLWFESGLESNWSADTLTYTDGANSVKISGISAENITLIFGDNGSTLYDELSASGCFDDAASEKIFEDKNKGLLA